MPVTDPALKQIDLRATELLFSRAFHDLISPISAVNNGVELMEEMGADAAGEAFELIGSSGKSASDRLAYFRIAYGAAGRDPNMAVNDARTVALRYFEERKVNVDWPRDLQLQAEGHVDPGLIKALMNVLLLTSEGLWRGGTVLMGANPVDEYTFTAEGPVAFLRPDQIAALMLETGSQDLDARTIHAWATGRFLHFDGFDVIIDQAPDEVIEAHLERRDPAPTRFVATVKRREAVED